MTRAQIEEMPQRWEMGQVVRTSRGPINILRLIKEDLDWDVEDDGRDIRVEYYEVWWCGNKAVAETSVGGDGKTWLNEYPVDILIN